MNILGISCHYHNSSASLIKDGLVVAAAEEERFTRVKHDASFPKNAIRFCLKKGGLTMSDIDHVGFYEKPLLKLERILYQHLATFPRGFRNFIRTIPSWPAKKLRIIHTLRKQGYRKEVMFINHHMSHAASFLLSPYKKAAIVSVDGVGEWTTTAYGIGEGNEIRLLGEIQYPHSIGLFYSTITALLGFRVNNSEYKVMALAAYGKKRNNPYYTRLKQIIDVNEDGSFSLRLRYFAFHYSEQMPSHALHDLLGGPLPKARITQRHKDIAAALQMITEEVMTKILLHAHAQTGCANLVLTGGVALNSVYNGKILASTPFKRVWLQPNPADGGSSLGVAAYIQSHFAKRPSFKTPYLGPAFTRSDIKEFLDQNKIPYTEFTSENELIEKTAELIHNNNIIGWFQEGMEWGPRALGARSILANPCNPKARDHLNKQVKHRELFRPFAPALCREDIPRYFSCDKPLPAPLQHMLMVYPCKKEWHKRIPSVIHVDGTGRLQAVEKNTNPRFHRLIKAFGKRSGIPILINTSFNRNNEPIVCTPANAYKCMIGTQIDYLIMDRFLVTR
ncbi:MAG: carbamoyltransferase family protein [Nanobdellota archaeon]